MMRLLRIISLPFVLLWLLLVTMFYWAPICLFQCLVLNWKIERSREYFEKHPEHRNAAGRNLPKA